ncbi:hypothetical protein AVO42_01790 [Thiomicrospira sp. XS5]|uniref:LapA family protein n=1 Tax=Thiomicrospira sp. XS5 TaxID=1775636 RepID=UPI000749ED31|nr:LapA family protein [Thiomicrospira sp. XS5]KUJ74174.1 hypothetical protein AVO42_01790 [Thiomicrospira sp. XS5]
MQNLTFKSILSWALIALSIIFILQNLVTVEVKFLMWSLSVPRAVLVAVMIGIGFVIGWFFSQHHHQKDTESS